MLLSECQNNVRVFFKILWPSDNIGTLLLVKITKFSNTALSNRLKSIAAVGRGTLVSRKLACRIMETKTLGQ